MKKDDNTYYERQARRADESLPYILVGFCLLIFCIVASNIWELFK